MSNTTLSTHKSGLFFSFIFSVSMALGFSTQVQATFTYCGTGSTLPRSVDRDRDCVPDSEDLCPDFADYSFSGIDTDGDGEGNSCDDDIDGDGVANADDCEQMVASAYAGATEKFNDFDDDCDGTVDNITLDENTTVLAGYMDGSSTSYNGYAVAAAGDANNDGFADLLVGSPQARLVEFYAGNEDSDVGMFDALGLAGNGDSETYDSSSDATDLGTGYVIAGGGDFDCDGYDDFALGLYNDNQVLIVRGKNPMEGRNILLGRSVGDEDAYLIHSDLSSDVDFGKSLAFIPSLDGDRCDELLIGSPGTNSSKGRTYLVPGGVYDYYALDGYGGVFEYDVTEIDQAVFEGEASGDYSGFAIASAGDFNGDGTGDILIGAYHNDGSASNAGKTSLFYGASTLTGTINMSSANLMFRGISANDNSGKTVAGVGDLNDDGYDDILIGATGYDHTFTTTTETTTTTTTYSNAGAVYLIYGMANKGVVTMTFNGNDYVISRKKTFSLSTADASFYGEAGADKFGSVVSAAGDLNTDGSPDFAVGSDNNDEGGTSAGKVYVFSGYATTNGPDYSGAYAATTAAATLVSPVPGNHAGISIAGLGDYNGDGYDDFVIGAYGSNASDPAFNGSGFDTAHVYLLLGFDGHTATEL